MFTYKSPQNRTSTRTVEPLKLINYQGRWYLLAWCTLRQATRTFHLARITSPAIGTKITQPRQTTDQHLESSFGIFKGNPRYHAEILFTGTAAELVKNQIWHKKQKILESDGGVIIQVPISDYREIMAKILQYGSQAVVLKPNSLVDIISKETQKMTALYQQ
jgi:predicted DNA-binding transcriptional regulator YafY